MTGGEAVQLLKAAGFHRYKVSEGGHEHWELGKHRIMVSTHSSSLDLTTIHRVRKLCEGIPTARDLARVQHQQKGELPRDITRPGDRITVNGRTATVRHVDYNSRTMKVEWDNATGGLVGEARTSVVPLTDVQLLREEREPAVEAEREEALPMAEEDGRQATGTILDELANLELAAEAEHEELVRFAERVKAYERLAKNQEVIGITIQGLPFRLDDGIAPVVERTEAVPPEPRPRLLVAKGEETTTERVLAFVRAEGGEISRGRIGQKFGGNYYRPMLASIEQLLSQGRLVERTVKLGPRRTKTVYALP